MSDLTRPALHLVDDDAAELAALTAAVDEARKDQRTVSHAAMRDWLLELASGKFDAPAPTAK